MNKISKCISHLLLLLFLIWDFSNQQLNSIKVISSGTIYGRTPTDLLAAPDQRLSSLPEPSSSSVRIWTGIDTHWCPSERLHPQQWWRLAGSGRWPAGEVPARESCCRWCWHPEPPPRIGPCWVKTNTSVNICMQTTYTDVHGCTQTNTQTDLLHLPQDGQADSLVWDFPEKDSVQTVIVACSKLLCT